MLPEKYSQPLKFIMVGIINTIVGYGAMFVCYNIMDWDYWIASALNYVVGSICSFFLNKYFTFRSQTFRSVELVKFILCICLCYFISYGLARSAIRWIARSMLQIAQDNLAMVIGSILFTCLNFLGQKFFVFQKMNKRRS